MGFSVVNNFAGPKKINYQALQEHDISLLYAWVNQPEIILWWRDTADDFHEFKNKYLAKILSDVEFPFLMYFDDLPMGYISYYIANRIGSGWWPDQQDGTYGIDLFIGLQEKLGCGYGSLFLKGFVDFLLKKPEVKKIIIDPSIDNFRAIRCYKNAGFRPQGQVSTPYGQTLLMEFYRDEQLYKPLISSPQADEPVEDV